MDPVVTGVVAGVAGTVMMDSLNLVFSGTGLISRIDVGMIGRMAAGWVRGRFCYRHPTELKEAANETFYGYLTHYAIGVGLAVPFVIAWALLFGRPPSPAWILVYGVVTTAASWFFVYPCLGFGAFGVRSPDGIKAPLSALANHLFYGLGLAIGVALAARVG